jgi:hypothetical protein
VGWLLGVLMGACLVVHGAAHAAPAGSERTLQPVTEVDSGTLHGIAGWLRRHGAEGYVGADVADVMGIPRLPTETLLGARQRGYRSDEVLRIAQISADAGRDFLLFTVQRPEEVRFYFSTVREGLQKAFVSIPSRNLVMPLDRFEAEARFRQEVRYWGDRMESK